MKKIESLVDNIEENIEKLGRTEIDSIEIGKQVMNQLKELDDVAYVRFASVYRKFKDRDEFINEIQELS